MWTTDGTGNIYYANADGTMSEILIERQQVIDKLNGLESEKLEATKAAHRRGIQRDQLYNDNATLAKELELSKQAQRELMLSNSQLVSKTVELMQHAAKGNRLVDCLPFDMHPDNGVEILLWLRHEQVMGTYNVLPVGDVLLKVRDYGRACNNSDDDKDPAARGRKAAKCVSTAASDVGPVQAE